MPPEPLILGFDTAAPHCAAALIGGGLSRVVVEPMLKGQAERLFPLLEEVLAADGLRWADLDALAVCTGPGNFTGVRLSVSAARGLALSLSRPAIGVSRLEALAHGQPRPLLVLVDARSGRVYAQLFTGSGAGEPELTTPEALAARDWSPGLHVLGFGAAEFAAATGAQVLGLSDATPPLALVHLAASRLRTPQPRPAPLYLREADAAPPSEAAPALLP